MSKLSIKRINANQKAYSKGHDAGFLDLANSEIQDFLPADIFDCFWLKSLNFSWRYHDDFSQRAYVYSKNQGDSNKFDTGILGQLNKLKSLEYLSLQGIDYRTLPEEPQLKDLKSLRRLDLEFSSLNSSLFLSELISLEWINLHSARLKELNGLKGLQKLETLYLAFNGLVDISPLGELISLKFLDLYGNKEISNLSPLSGLSALEHLNIGSTKINRIAPLAKVKSLKRLILNSNKIEDLKTISEIISLEELFLVGLNLKEIDFIFNLQNLKVLCLNANRIRNLAPLSSLPNITELHIDDNKLTDISHLKENINLKYLDLSANQLTDILPLSRLVNLEELHLFNNKIKEISPLKSLSHLKTLSIGLNKVSNASPISELYNLRKLDISNNEIIDISSLKNLTNLIQVIMMKNEISDISSLVNLSKIERLYAQENLITSIPSLSQLKNLKELDLSHNLISNIDNIGLLTDAKEINLSCNKRLKYVSEKAIKNLSNFTRLSLFDCPISNIPKAIINSKSNIAMMKDFFRDLNISSIKVYEEKILIVGNGRVGKTSLLKRLLDNKFKVKEPSTHGIVLREWQLKRIAKANRLDNIRVNLWDFGGQDIYDSTHRVFMNTGALFILVWDFETENNLYQKEVLSDGRSIEYQNHSIRYWLSYIKALSGGQVLIVQTKMDKDGIKKPDLTDEEKIEFNVVGYLSVDSSRAGSNGFASLKEMIEFTVQESLQHTCTILPNSWYFVRSEIDQLLKSNEKSIDIHAFEIICNKHNLDKKSRWTVLEFLHNSGIIFYQKGVFNDEIIINQKWAIDAVYKLLDRNDFYWRLHGKGYFTGDDLASIWDETYSWEEQQLFLQFMLRCEVCFSVEKDTAEYFRDQKFMCPQLLTTVKPIESIASAFYDSESIFIRYRHKFLHDSVIQRFIGRSSVISQSRELWRNGILIRVQNGAALVEANPERNEIIVRVKARNFKLMIDIQSYLEAAATYNVTIEVDYSNNGIDYVSSSMIKSQPEAYEMVLSTDGKWIENSAFQDFLNRELDDELNEDNMSNKPNVYFSYAWNSASDDLVTKLSESLKNDGFTVIRDKENLNYKDSISEFMKNIGRANIVIIPICEKYLKSDNCMFELSELYRNSKQEKSILLKKIFPIRLESINLKDPKVLREYFSFWKTREQEFKNLVNDFGYNQEEHRRIETINNDIRDLIPFLHDIYAYSVDVISIDNFELIKKKIVQSANN